MEQLTDESKFVLAQLFLEDPISETPKIHSKKREKRQGTLLKEVDTLIHEIEEIDPTIDVEPYKEAVKYVRKIKGKDAYNAFIDDLLRPYEF